MRSVNFELQISEKKCALYTGKYGIPDITASVSLVQRDLRRTGRESHSITPEMGCDW